MLPGPSWPHSGGGSPCLCPLEVTSCRVQNESPRKQTSDRTVGTYVKILSRSDCPASCLGADTDWPWAPGLGTTDLDVALSRAGCKGVWARASLTCLKLIFCFLPKLLGFVTVLSSLPRKPMAPGARARRPHRRRPVGPPAPLPGRPGRRGISGWRGGALPLSAPGRPLGIQAFCLRGLASVGLGEASFGKPL